MRKTTMIRSRRPRTTTTLSSPRIPQELCEKVIAYLTVKYDPDRDVEEQNRYFTLRQCALVCRAWLPSVRSRIFRLVHLSYLGADRLRELVNLSPGLAQYMTKVVVWGPTASGRSCPLELVAELAPKLTAVMNLTVCGDHEDRSSP
ncbi:hypothetical protein C8J57DRAFT_1278068 [Mycena rebaudengoi]|nr:hypothetical protein C8J57DRAFT_1278068 [Mycena rebaudengoi]